MNLFDMLKADKGIPVSDPMARLWGYQYQQKHGVSEISGVPPLHFTSRGEHLLDYRIYGNTVQDGTPAPENPVEVQGCGEYDAELNGYKIPVTVTGENLLNSSDIEEGGYSAGAGTVLTKMDNPVRCRLGYIVTISTSTMSVYIPNGKINFVWVDKDGISLGVSGFQVSGSTVVAPSNAVYFTLIFALLDGTRCTPSDFLHVTIVEGVTPPNRYKPYHEPITTPIYTGNEPLHKIGDYADYVDFKRGVVVRRIKKVVFTGNETFLKNYPEKSDSFLYYHGGYRANEYCFCTHLVNNGTIPINEVGVFNLNNVLYFNFGSAIMYAQPSGNTTAGLKEYLVAQYEVGTPVTVWYVLAKPKEKPLENLLPIQTVKGSDILTVDTTVQPSNIWIKGKIKAID